MLHTTLTSNISVISLASRFENDPYHFQSEQEEEENLLLSDDDVMTYSENGKLRKNWNLKTRKN